MFNSIYFWIFGVFVPKSQMGFNFVIFSKFGVFTSFCVPPYFLGFSWHNVGRGLGWSIWISIWPLLQVLLHWDACRSRTPDFLFGWVNCYLLLWFLLDLCFGFVDTRICVESTFSNWGRWSEFMTFGSCYIIGIRVESMLSDWSQLSEFMMYGFLLALGFT